ncbi:unnamed protein product [Natator depressus]
MAVADEGGRVWLGRKVSGSASEPAGTLPCSGAETWPLKRYGRFVSPGAPPCGAGASASWKVLESNEESGYLILTIVVSGHFFISQRRAVQEGFSLIDAHKWLKIVRRADCLLFGSKLKNECRMFRIQFGGDSKEQALEHCYNCVQKLADYVTVQVTDEQSQELHQGHSQLANRESQVKDSEQNTSMLHGVSQKSVCVKLRNIMVAYFKCHVHTPSSQWFSAFFHLRTPTNFKWRCEPLWKS